MGILEGVVRRPESSRLYAGLYYQIALHVDAHTNRSR